MHWVPNIGLRRLHLVPEDNEKHCCSFIDQGITEHQCSMLWARDWPKLDLASRSDNEEFLCGR